MKKDPTAGELAQWLRQLCPGREADFVRALRWLYDHPRRELLLSIQSGGRPEYLALAAWRLVGESENRK